MARYILMYRGSGEPPSRVVQLIENNERIRLLDRFGDNLIVSGEREDVRQLVRRIGSWIVSPERRIRHPEMRFGS